MVLAIDKNDVLVALIAALEATHQQAEKAALQAYQTATDVENIAENKYDTLGLEASYLAQGQAKRVAQCLQDIHQYRRLRPTPIDQDSPISIGSLVSYRQDALACRVVFIGPAAGGLSFDVDGTEVVVVTPVSPLGTLLLGSYLDDTLITRIGGVDKRYQIIGHI
ncbi:hypothetical protein SIN8267_01314 [Sinobacterium norvegicum]|uniref:Transcription elongation factor n=1 Tax=Sinobacterium norvegicum TaxID=1641715 RepID=A0ABM9ADE2_9GAMM|nr:hypothetical protein [Sinobacterium norvegicum]CAH0991212.1 hypothetical protein SIN8267_01314 [Sinobacterium norvegicum]